MGLWLCGLFVAVGADTYPMTDGTSLTGDVISYNDNGIVFRLEGDKYSQRVPWTKFSQDALKQLANNPKIRLLAEPFIETAPVVERTKKAEVKVHEVSRLDLPPKPSLFGALFSSSVGLVVLMLIYAANIFAGYEIAVVRSRPIAQVMGVAVVLPILGPIIFLALPVRVVRRPERRRGPKPRRTRLPCRAPPSPWRLEFTLLRLPGRRRRRAAGAAAPQIFQRGQFTFNRRFFETKFSGFFAMFRREAEKNLMLTVKTGRTLLVVERITRIATNEMHVEIVQGTGKKEIMVPFSDIVEVQLKPKDA